MTRVLSTVEWSGVLRSAPGTRYDTMVRFDSMEYSTSGVWRITRMECITRTV
jgi:hypothetical protein